MKGNIAAHIQELIENCGHLEIEPNIKSKHKNDAKAGFEKYKCRFILEDKVNNAKYEYNCVVVIRCPNFIDKYLYDIIDIKKVSPSHR